MDLYLAISNDGQMTGQEMLHELQEHRICPIMTYEEDGKKIVPVFFTTQSAQRFAKRNTPRDYSIGVMLMNDSDKQQLEESGFTIVQLQFPKKRDITIHVMHLSREVVTHNKGFRKSIK